MSDLRPAGPLDTIQPLRDEREAFIALLTLLEPEEWNLATECPAWSVKGIALHVLGDDFSLLSRQRDAAVNSLALMAEEAPDLDFRARLDAFNERWVHRAMFMSTRLIVELLGVTGKLTAGYYAEVDPDLLGEPVPFVGPDPAPYWMIAAREYVERWVHHSQVARATSRPVPAEAEQVVPAVASIMRGFPGALSLLPAPAGSQVTIALREPGVAWTVVKDGDTWSLHDGRADEPAVLIDLPVEVAAALFSRGLDRSAILATIEVSGPGDLPGQVKQGLGGFFARS